jgi:hypothetical protein
VVRPGLEAPFNGPQDGPELAVVDTDNDDQSAVRVVSFRPATGDVGEVGDIERNHDAVLVGSQFQERLVGGAVEPALVVGGAHIMMSPSECSGDTTPRDVGVEEEAHGSAVRQISMTSTPG